MVNKFSNRFPFIYSITPKTTDFMVRDYYFNLQAKKLGINFQNWMGFNSKVLSKFVDFKEINQSSPKEPFGFKLVTMAHISLLEYAYEMEYPNLVVFENDVLFYKDFNKIIDSALQDLPEDWDVFYLGATYSEKNSVMIKVGEYLYNLRGSFLTAHSYAINRKAMKRIIDRFYGLLNESKSLYCIDQFLGHFIASDDKYNVYGVVPKLTDQGYFGEKSLSCPTEFDTFTGHPSDFKSSSIVVREPHFEEHKVLYSIRKEDYLHHV